MHFWEPRPRQPLSGVAICAVLGIALADWWRGPVWMPLAACGSALLLVLARPSTLACWLFSAVLFFTLHLVHYDENPGRELATHLASGRQVTRATGIVITEPEKPSFFSQHVTCQFRIRLEAIELAGISRRAGALVNVSWAGAFPSYGDRVTFTGSASVLDPRRNPGQFDASGYLQRQGVYAKAEAPFAADCRILGHGHGNPVQAFGFFARRWMQQQLALDLADSPEITALIQSMVLGLRGETPDEAREVFQRTGTLHLFAVSGLNVAMLAGICLFILKPSRMRRGHAVFVIIPILAAYAVVTGLSASCVRATIMGSLLLLGHVFDRRAVPCNSLAAAALGILAWDTNQLFSPGFQFSFVLVLAIIWLAGRIHRRVQRALQPDPFLPKPLWSWRFHSGVWVWDKIAASLGVTLAAWIGSLAFTAGYFHLFSPVAIVANLVAVLLAFIVLALGLLTVMTAPILPSAALLFSNANWAFASTLLAVVKAFALVPGGHLYLEQPRFGVPPSGELWVLDLGEGGATHVRAGDRDWLIDCGSRVGYERVVLPYLRTRGVNRLAGFVITHGDAQHLGGAIPLLDDFHPRLIVDSALRDRSRTRTDFHSALELRRRGKAISRGGDPLRLSPGTEMQVLFPPAGLQRSTADDKALVVQIVCAGWTVLLMSDSGFSTEQWLLENEPGLRSDIVIKGQHGKDVSGTANFLNRVNPQAVICAAETWRDPTSDFAGWESALAAHHVAVFPQQRTGAVHVELREDAFTIRGFRGGQTFRSRAR